MNVIELQRLHEWYADYFPTMNRLYTALLEPINHNATQPDKRPIESELNALTDYLEQQPLDELSLQQLRLLGTLGVDIYIGRAGAALVEGVVRTSHYDPATARDRLNDAVNAINSAHEALRRFQEASVALGFSGQDPEAENGLITIRVGFQNDVAIDNVTDWRNTAKEWYDIIRGLSMACDEKPEDVRVVGAATGSIILILAAGVSFTLLLARISKNITSVAQDIIGVRSAAEDLRQKKILTRAMEAEFKRIENEKRDGAVTAIEALLDGALAGKDGEVKTALTNSIKKLLTFNEKGGTVDFVAPEEPATAEEGDTEAGDLHAALAQVRSEILALQGAREQLKLLTDGTKTPET